MIKNFVISFLLVLWASVAFATENVLLNSLDEYVVREEGVIDYVVGHSGIVDVKRLSDSEYVIIPLTLKGKTYVMFIKSQGNSNYIVEVDNNRADTLNKKRSKLVSGYLRGRMGFSDRNDQTPYSLNLNLITKTSENSTFSFNIDHYNNPAYSSESETYLTGWAYTYLDYYLSWRPFPEPVVAPFYITNRFRGYTLGKQNNDIDVGVWTANKYLSNNKEDNNFKAQGFFLKDSYEGLTYRFILNNKDDRTIPQASFSFMSLGILNNLSGSFLEDKYSFRYFGVKNFNKGSENFNLKSVTGLYSVAPNGAFGLDNKNDNFYETYGGSVNFSNREKDVQEVQRDIDFLEGIVSASAAYDASIFNETRSDSITLFAGYGKMDKLTLSGSTNYSVSTIDNLSSEQFSYTPRLSFFFIGDKNDGYSLRNEYHSQVTKDYAGNISERYRNIIGAYRNTRKYYYGVYGGNSSFSAQNVETTSRVLGADLVYWVQDSLSLRVWGENVTASETGNYENRVSFESKGVYKKDLTMFGKVTYEENNDIVNARKQSSVVGTVGFIWNFGFGEGNVYSNIDSATKKISGTLYNDINFNGQRDENEPTLSGIGVSVVKTGTNKVTTDSDGEFDFTGFSSKETVTVSFESEKYASGKQVSLNMNRSQHVDVPMYEYTLKKVYVKNSQKENIFTAAVVFSCERNNRLQKELYSDYTLYYFPKNQVCEPELSTATSGGVIISDVKNIGNDTVVVNLEELQKVISFEFTGKMRNFQLNNKLISPTSNPMIVPINEFEGFLDIKLPKNCSISPQNFRNSYNNLKNQNFYKISCF